MRTAFVAVLLLTACAVAEAAESKPCHPRRGCPTTTTTLNPTTTTPNQTHTALGFHTLHRASDEFNTLSLGNQYGNTSPFRWHTKAYGTYSGDTAVAISNGVLQLHMRRTNGSWSNAWLSGNWTYQGARYMEARLRFPAGNGLWMGFWEWEAPWGQTGLENDVIEQLGREPTSYHTTLHSSGSHPGYRNDVGVLLAGGGWHTYGAAVYATRVDYFFDDRLVRSIALSQAPSWGFNTQPFVLNLSTHLGDTASTWEGELDPNLPPALEFEVDWVRVWT